MLHPSNDAATVHPGRTSRTRIMTSFTGLAGLVRRRIHVRYLTSKCFFSSKLSVALVSLEERRSSVKKDMTE